MGFVKDRWMRPGPAGKRVRSDLWGRGKRWQAVWIDPDGRERARACASKDEAQALLAKVAVDMSTGSYVSVQAGRETFKEYAERWREQQLHHRATTAAQAKSRLTVHVYPVLGTRAIGSIRRSDVQALVTGMAEKLAPATVEVTYAYISAVFKMAVEDRLIAASPCMRINLPALERTRMQPLTWEQVAAIRKGLPAHWQAVADLAAASGLRSGELRGLTVDRITPGLHLRRSKLPKSVVIRVDRQLAGREAGGAPLFGPPKTPAADRSVRVGASTVTALVKHLEEFGVGPGGLVFASRRQPGALSRSRAGEVWRAAVDGLELGGERRGWHELRHFHASLLIASGLSVRAVADRLGHQDPAETLRTYAHLWPTDEDRAVAAYEEGLAARSGDGPRTVDGHEMPHRRSGLGSA
ncbi:tyrosine-type recombinase/integrase [Enterococcus hirae]|uniref:tyrosine-type recombinase/integrase n=1 Tax=Enterococcus hirae TaxID=1354 RepID=UPI001371C41E|nr:site-specific integrase [Enterococcus hirae]NAE18279.1 tyrosine-type recombinase/integrase [Enterococcus hirae]